MDNFLTAVIWFLIGALAGVSYASLPSTSEVKRFVNAAAVMILVMIIGMLMVVLSTLAAPVILPEDTNKVNILVTAMLGSAASVIATLQIIHLRTSPDRSRQLEGDGLADTSPSRGVP